MIKIVKFLYLIPCLIIHNFSIAMYIPQANSIPIAQQIIGIDGNGDSPLHLAAARGQSDFLEQLLKTDALRFIEQKNNFNCTPLHCAADSLSFKCIDMILRSGAQNSINHQDVVGRTPLHIALNSIIRSAQKDYHDLREESLRAVDLLVSSGANVMLKNNREQMPINIAIEQATQAHDSNWLFNKLVNVMFDSEKREQQQDPKTFNPSRVMFPPYNLGCGQYICEYHVSKVYGPRTLGNKKYYEQLKLFDQQISDVRGNTPLHWVVRDYCPACLKFLLNHGHHVCVNERNNWGNTPLHIVLNEFIKDPQKKTTEEQEVCQKMTKLLVSHGADIMLKNSSNQMPINMALEQVNGAGHDLLFFIKLVDVMLDGERQWQIINPKRFSPSRVLFPTYNPAYGQSMCVNHASRLLGSIVLANIDQRKQFLLFDKMPCDGYGNTPLHLAAKNCCIPCIKFLLTHGHRIYINRKNKWGNPPLFLACTSSYGYSDQDLSLIAQRDFLSLKYKVINILIRNGADMMVQDNAGRTLYSKVRGVGIRLFLLRWHIYKANIKNEILFLLCLRRMSQSTLSFTLPPKIRQLIGDYIVGQRPDQDENL